MLQSFNDKMGEPWQVLWRVPDPVDLLREGFGVTDLRPKNTRTSFDDPEFPAATVNLDVYEGQGADGPATVAMGEVSPGAFAVAVRQ